jgi:hypothetical protein
MSVGLGDGIRGDGKRGGQTDGLDFRKIYSSKKMYHFIKFSVTVLNTKNDSRIIWISLFQNSLYTIINAFLLLITCVFNYVHAAE